MREMQVMGGPEAGESMVGLWVWPSGDPGLCDGEERRESMASDDTCKRSSSWVIQSLWTLI